MKDDVTMILDAEDILADARNCVECVFRAMRTLDRDEAGPLQTVADIASTKIGEAIDLLNEYRKALGFGPAAECGRQHRENT